MARLHIYLPAYNAVTHVYTARTSIYYLNLPTTETLTEFRGTLPDAHAEKVSLILNFSD